MPALVGALATLPARHPQGATVYTYKELIALLASLADPEHRFIAGFTTQELTDLDYLFSRIREQIAAELSIRKD